jgi:flagellar basal-body rod protein FlgG
VEVSQRIAVTGLLASQRQLDVVANNLSNLNTTGFKRARAQTSDIGYEGELTAPVGPGGAAVRLVGVGEGTQIASLEHEFLPGSVQATGQPFDVALQGDGFLQVQLPDGQTGYTRDGSLGLDADGHLVTGGGLPVLSDTRGPLQLPAGAVEAHVEDGGQLVSVDATGQSQPIGQIGLVTFANNAGLEAQGQNVWLATAASGPATAVAAGAPNAPALVAGALEGSNVDVADEFTRLVQAQRSYQLNAKVVQAWDDIAHMANELRSGT